nr:hypothetical protein BN993_06997 [Virgibacillus halodenitrificans]
MAIQFSILMIIVKLKKLSLQISLQAQLLIYFTHPGIYSFAVNVTSVFSNFPSR